MTDGDRSLRDIGRRIVALREAMGMNQTAFAQLTDIKQNALANYEAGTRRPDLDQAYKLVAKTGVTLDWVYLGDRSGLPHRLLALIEEFDQSASRFG